MIVIHVWADGTFTTQCGGQAMSPWAEHQQAAKHGCQQTLVAYCDASGRDFYAELDKLNGNGLVRLADDPVMGKWGKPSYSIWRNATAWQLWAAVCMMEFGAFFTVVTQASFEEVLRDRLERLIQTRGEASLGVLVNLVRPIPCSKVTEVLCSMVRNKTLKMEVRANPRNHKETSIFSLT